MSNTLVKSSIHSIRSVVPEWIVEEHHGFVELLEGYYKWCESSGQLLSESKQLLDNYNYNLVANNKLFLHKDVFLRLFPVDNPDLIRTLLKFSNVFYRSRGNVESYKFLFKLLWNENIDIEFPSEYILRSSDGIWVSDTLIHVEPTDTNIDIDRLIGKTILGSNNGKAVIESIRHRVSGESEVYLEITLSGITGSFDIDEIITVDGEAFTGIIMSTYGNYTIKNRGKGYLAGSTIPVKSSTGTGFSVTVTEVDMLGRILSIAVTPGTGYHYANIHVDLEHESLKDTTIHFEPAEIEFSSSAIFHSTGYYKQLKSALSDKWKLRDGHYYQEYSYVIKSDLQFDTLYRPVIDLLHPAGMKLWVNTDNDYSSISGETRVLWHDTLKIVSDSGVEISDRNVQNLNVVYNHIVTPEGSLQISKNYSFDESNNTTGSTLDDRVYFSYEKVLLNVIDGE